MLLEIIIAAVAIWLLLKIISLPIKLIWKLAINTGCGFLILMGLNWLTPYTGISFQENLVTAVIAGFLGIPGVILLCVGVLSLVSREGTFDTLAYAGRAFIRMFQSGRKHQRFGDFVMERREKRKEKKSLVAPFMVVGGLFVAAAVFCLVMYYQV